MSNYDEKTITRKEISQLLGVRTDNLSQLVRNGVAMPEPIGRDRNFLIYDRKAIMSWLEHYQTTRKQAEPGLDNTLAQQFLFKL